MPKRSNKISLKDDAKLKKVNPKNLQLYKLYEMDMTMRNLAPSTIKVYKTDLMGWFVYILDNQANQEVIDLTEEDIFDFIYFCKTSGNNTKRIQGRLSALSAFYKFLAKKKKLRNGNPMEFIDRPKGKKGESVVEQTFLTKDQVDEMKQKLTEHGDLQLKLYALLSLSTMARVTAVSNIMWKQIDFENRRIYDVIEKEGYKVTLCFSPEVKELLLQWKSEREANEIMSDYVFITRYGKKSNKASVSALWDWTKKIGKMIGVPSLHPHDFRHSMATILKNNGMDLEAISKLLNHINMDVTRKFYIKEDMSKMQEDKDKYEI